jgi:hypothetical protein
VGLVEEMVVWWRWWERLMRDLVKWWWWSREWMGDLIERSFMPILPLMKTIKHVLHLCEAHSLPVDVLPVSFNTLDCSLPSQDGLLFLPKPLNFLLDSS